MIIFWIFALIFGVSAFSYGFLLMGWGAIGSVLFALAGVLAIRGVLSWIRRVLVLRERLPDEADAELRTLETNRYIFWRRVVFLALFPGVEVVVAYLFLLSSGQAPLQAILTILQFVGQALLLAVQLAFIIVANFMFFFGPFVLFTLLGRQTLLPGDANYGVKIEDVRGQKSAVEEMKKILKLMERGRNYVKAGGQRERGVLLVGPPGTGKTMLAKAIATSMQTPIIISSGAGLQGIFIGMDAIAVYLMIRAAKKKAKRWGGCTIFIDEFDALGQSRGGMGGGIGGLGGIGGMFGGFRLGLNMLLVLMDGIDNPGFIKRVLRRFVNITLDGLFIPPKIKLGDNTVNLRVGNIKPPRYNIFFLGATNRPSVLDEAVTRPGRFGRQINFELPKREARKDIADLYFSKKAHDPELDSPARREEFARITEGSSPAEIEQILSLALMYAFEDGRSRFTWKDLREALVNVRMGLAKPVEYSEHDQVAVARHEMGHAVAARFYMPSHSPMTLSIRMRGNSLGHNSSVPREEEFIQFRSQAAGHLRWGLGAIASERVFYGENTNGVTGDLIEAARLASHIIGVWGMGPDPLPPDQSSRAADIGESLIGRAEVTAGMHEQGTVVGTVLSNPMSRRMVAQVLGSAYIDCWRLMFVNRDAIDRGADMLVTQREMVGGEVESMLDSIGLRMFSEKDPYPDEVALVPPSKWERNGEDKAAAVGVRPA
jgi:ATP-dependent Zn protease